MEDLTCIEAVAIAERLTDVLIDARPNWKLIGQLARRLAQIAEQEAD
jgi:hypothetical protein